MKLEMYGKLKSFRAQGEHQGFSLSLIGMRSHWNV
jgi:hypothetical protein